MTMYDYSTPDYREFCAIKVGDCFAADPHNENVRHRFIKIHDAAAFNLDNHEIIYFLDDELVEPLDAVISFHPCKP